MNLNPEPFEMIKSGAKTIELRLNDEKRRKIKIGDEIEFTETENEHNKLLTLVTDIFKFSSFEQLYKSLPLLKCGYTVDELSSVKPSDMDFYYSKEKQQQYGVLGIEVKVK